MAENNPTDIGNNICHYWPSPCPNWINTEQVETILSYTFVGLIVFVLLTWPLQWGLAWKRRVPDSGQETKNEGASAHFLDVEIIETPRFIKNLNVARSIRVTNNGPTLEHQCLAQVEDHGIVGIPDPLVIRTEGQIRGKRTGRFTLSKDMPKFIPLIFRHRASLQYMFIGEDSEEYGFTGSLRCLVAIYAGNITKKTEITFDPDQMKDAVGQWDDLETAAQYVYNELTSGRFSDAGQLRQAMKAFDGVWGGVSGWIVEGIRSNIIKARGLCERRTIVEPIPHTLKGSFDSEYPDGCVEDQQGLMWQITEINRQSLDEYLKELEENDDSEGGPKEG